MKQLIIFLFFCPVEKAFAQTVTSEQAKPGRECQTKAETAADRSEIKMLKQAYYAKHQNDPKAAGKTAADHILLGWPMRASSEYDFTYNYFTIGNFVDQHRFVVGTDGEFEDYHCQNRTYDEHDASDINLYPFWWRMMDNNRVMAVAAAPGVILRKRDGNFDHNCSATGSPNSITILHDDGTVTGYLHLKINSLTGKGEEERVEEGEFLGYIGSSGRSTFPHLHFSVYDINDELIEPFFDGSFASCNSYSTETWWKAQRPYWEPQVNRLMTHSSVPSLEWCPGDEVVYAKNNFDPGDLVYTGIAFKDAQNGDIANCSLIRPNGTTTNWNVNISQTNDRQYKTTAHLLPSGNTGTWIFRVTYRSRVYAHFFSVGCRDTETVSGSVSGNDGYIASNLVTSTAIHSGSSNTKVLYQAANEVLLKPGFEAQAGIHFKARIKQCNYTE